MPEPNQWSAKWCWTKKHLSRPWNYYAYFRRIIELPARPRRAEIRITADARYTLYVNGRWVHQGPARSFPQHQSFDTIDLAPHLSAGRNAICAIVHQFGVPTFFSVYRDASGFLLDGVVEVDDQTIPLHTPEGWMCREATAWRKDVARLTIQMGFQEHFDADQEPGDWRDTDYVLEEKDGWHIPRPIGPAGTHPWLKLEPRGVSLLANHEEKFVAITAQFSGENARGYKVADDVYLLALSENRRRDKNLLDNEGGMLHGTGLTTINPPPDGHFRMLTLDLGLTRTGVFMLDIADAAGDEIIDILYTEAVDKSGGPALIPRDSGSSCEEATASRYRCRAGPQKWETFHYIGLRYATLVFRNLTKPLKLRHVGLRQIHAALEPLGEFECSDSTLNEIWKVGRETQRNCMFDAYVDCPWREQAMWWGDARIQFQVTAHAYGDVSLLERGIHLVAQSQGGDKSLHAHPPSDAPNHRLPDFMLTWAMTLWDYYFHTGRKEPVEQHKLNLIFLLAFFAKHRWSERGLIGGFEGMWVFLDWQTLFKSDYSAVLNMMYLQALRCICKMFEVIGNENANSVSRMAEVTEAAIINHFWDEKAGLWRDGWDVTTGQMVESVSQHANALAILLDLKPETHQSIAKNVVLKSADSRRSKILTASPFFYAYVLEALAKAGFREDVIRIIREKWGKMIDKGATTFWEVWEPTYHSRCHAWSASPVYHLMQHVLGVTPTEPGWNKVRIAPCSEKLDYARGKVPSPLGVIKVEWERAGEDQLAVRIELPEGMSGEFLGPTKTTRPLRPGAQEFST